MKRIIKLTERDLTRIVRRVINERQYLMEDDVRKVIPIEIAIPAVKNQKTGKLEPKSDTAYLSYFAKNSPGKNGMSSLMNETNFLSLKFGDIECSKPSGCLKTSKKDDQGNIVGSIYADQKLLNVLKTWVGQTDSSGSLGMKISTNGPEANTVIGSPKVYYKEIQPTQKESDLRRIVKNVMNERRYLMEGEDISKLEPAITNWINAMNAVYGTQMKLGKSGTNVNITGGVRDIFLYALPLTFPDDKAKIYPRITNGFKTIKSDMAGQDPNKKLLFMTCIPKLASSGGKVPQGCETVMKDPSIITKANAMNTAYDNLVRLVTPAQ